MVLVAFRTMIRNVSVATPGQASRTEVPLSEQVIDAGGFGKLAAVVNEMLPAVAVPVKAACVPPITYQLESGQPTVVTHRIIATSENQKGERTFITQGDANGERDEKEVRPVQIRGKVWYSLPYLGYVNTWLTGEQRTVIVVIVVTALLLYAAYMMISGIRDGRKERARARLAPDPAASNLIDSAQIEKGQHDALAP